MTENQQIALGKIPHHLHQYLLTPEQLDTWCTALESAAFRQGRGRMFDHTLCAYCCLGVARKVLSRGGDWEFALQPSELFGPICVNGHFEFLGMPLLQGHASLSQANDNGVLFSDIAAHLREHMPTRETAE